VLPLRLTPASRRSQRVSLPFLRFYRLLMVHLHAVTVMNVVRMIKMFGWETKMGDQLREKRNDELKLIMQRFYLSLLNQNVK
jgi:hypothetical protein